MSQPTAGPVIKWAGGKTQLLTQLLAAAPARCAGYFEPFAGGAALFFALSAAERIERAVLSDLNPDLLNFYRVLRDDLPGLLCRLTPLAEAYAGAGQDERSALFYELRAETPERPAAAAARFLFLNRTCYNGLYRVNRGGRFNVPHGRYPNPRICHPPTLAAASAALQRAEIRGPCGFETVLDWAGPGDFVYFDPPYQPLSTTSSFTAYTGEDFGWEQQVRLSEVFNQLASQKVSVLLSNSAHPSIVELYGRAHDVRFVQARRAINSQGGLRGPISEVLVAAGPTPP